MQLKNQNGQTMFVNDEKAYKNYLERTIMQYQSKNQEVGLSNEEITEVNDLMYQYNQLVVKKNENQYAQQQEEQRNFRM